MQNIFKIKSKVIHVRNWTMKNIIILKVPNKPFMFYSELEKSFVPLGHTINHIYKVTKIDKVYLNKLSLKEKVVWVFGGEVREPDYYVYYLLNLQLKSNARD